MQTMKPDISTWDKYLEVVKHHHEKDMFVQVLWLKDEKVGDLHKGCDFGCVAQMNGTDAVKWVCENSPMPHWLGFLSERIFEGLPSEYSINWPLQRTLACKNFAEKGGDFEDANCKIHIKRLEFLAQRFKEVAHVINPVIELYKRKLAKETIDPEEWKKAEKTATWSAEAAEEESALAESLAAAAKAARTAALTAWAEALAEYEASSWAAEAATRTVRIEAVWSADLAVLSNMAKKAAKKHWQRERDWVLEVLGDV